jgi:hypothetical protein
VVNPPVRTVARQAPVPPARSPDRIPLPTMTMPGTTVPTDTDSRTEYQIQLEPPGLHRLSRLDSDPKLQERIRQEARGRDEKDRVEFPPSPILSRDTYRGRGPIWPGRQMVVEPVYVCYERLFFEEKNSERYGWDLGVVSPVLLALNFYKDLALLPMHAGTDPCRLTDCSAGHCLPGDPVPYLLYPPEVSLTGSAAELAVIFALIAIFP